MIIKKYFKQQLFAANKNILPGRLLQEKTSGEPEY